MTTQKFKTMQFDIPFRRLFSPYLYRAKIIAEAPLSMVFQFTDGPPRFETVTDTMQAVREMGARVTEREIFYHGKPINGPRGEAAHECYHDNGMLSFRQYSSPQIFPILGSVYKMSFDSGGLLETAVVSDENAIIEMDKASKKNQIRLRDADKREIKAYNYKTYYSRQGTSYSPKSCATAMQINFIR